jgi:hypothetical protein
MSNRIIQSTHSGQYRYYYVRCPLKYKCMSDHNGYVQESRLIMAIYRGYPLCKNELVIHVDGNTLNNEISNLKIVRKRCKRK